MDRSAPAHSHPPVATATKAGGSRPPTLLSSTSGKTVEGTDTAQTPIHELLTEDMVNVYVGSKRKKFHLHKDLVCDRSSFFKKALAGGFKEQDEKAIYLPEDDVGGFVLFVQWIYGVSPQESTSPEMLSSLFALYVLAEKFCIESLKNLSIDVIRTHCSNSAYMHSGQNIRYIYDNTPETSPMRRFVVNHSLYGLLVRKIGMAKDFLELMKKGGDFAADFASATLQYSTGTLTPVDPSREKNCVYHEHHSTKSCPLYAGFQESRLKGW